MEYLRNLRKKYLTWYTFFRAFFTQKNPLWPRAVFTALGLLAFAKLFTHALVRILAVAFLMLWGEIADAQPYELFGELHRGEYWYYARALYLGAAILAFDAFMCIGQAMNSLHLYMELRERLSSNDRRTKRHKLR